MSLCPASLGSKMAALWQACHMAYRYNKYDYSDFSVEKRCLKHIQYFMSTFSLNVSWYSFVF